MGEGLVLAGHSGQPHPPSQGGVAVADFNFAGSPATYAYTV